MNCMGNMKYLKNNLFPVWKRFFDVQSKKKQQLRWIEPGGFKTNVSVYNSVTKCKVPLILKNENSCTWYMCGPTVYDSAHIGHACTYVKFDIIQRILTEYFNIHPIVIMSITDIDDKIIKRSIESGKSWKELTRFYEEEFFEDMQSLNVSKPYMFCRVSEYIPHIIKFVDNIVSKDGAYVTKDGSVYFDTAKWHTYGKLNKPMPNESHPEKKSSLDFALWKAVKAGEPSWESPWGHGRPGWHIECSTIASTIFGNTIDIHSGGIDLAFPHHENEEAQSCCHYDIEQWVNYWLHSGHLHLHGDTKMSKSLKNTVSIRELFNKYTANQFRMFCLLSHYRNGVEFSDITMQIAVSTLKKFESFISDCDNFVADKLCTGDIDESLLLQCLSETKHRVQSAVADDFNTPSAIHELLNLISLGNKMLHLPKDPSKSHSKSSIAVVSNYIIFVLLKFGISYSVKSDANDHKLKSVIEELVNFRSSVRIRALEQGVKDKVLLTACDTVRKNLLIHGIEVKDYKKTSTWNILREVKMMEN
ncbi:probable cysteine--tRNA ligase, mitochondrial [Cephus cinctus]|uniref:cysteine--tRNA ligase n=1 Tax=Cephus cinctus TaxID=211228 RepID=A0AAJ7CGD0_CEPCN|nr:probable cysteine--tRNA ligase, mitochondrial [Cephus cinctus]